MVVICITKVKGLSSESESEYEKSIVEKTELRRQRSAEQPNE